MIKANEGPMDRLARAIVGVVLLLFAINSNGGLQILLYVLAVICLLTAATGFCGIYGLFKCSTVKKEIAPTDETKPEAPESKEELTTEEIKADEAPIIEAASSEPTTNVMSEPEPTPVADAPEAPVAETAITETPAPEAPATATDSEPKL